MPLSGLPPSPPQAELPQAERPAHTPSSPSREPGYEETAPETAKGEGSSKRYKGAKLPPLKEELLGGRAMKEQIARATRKVPSPKDIIKFDTKEFRYIGYMQRLKEKIEGIWVYPRKAIEKGLYGDLRIKFVIKKDGTLGEAVVVRTSGHPVLDEAALKALREAQPFWPLPEEWGSEGFTVDGHFVYTLYGKYVR
jgi:protein TonB